MKRKGSLKLTGFSSISGLQSMHKGWAYQFASMLFQFKAMAIDYVTNSEQEAPIPAIHVMYSELVHELTTSFYKWELTSKMVLEEHYNM